MIGSFSHKSVLTLDNCLKYGFCPVAAKTPGKAFCHGSPAVKFPDEHGGECDMK